MCDGKYKLIKGIYFIGEKEYAGYGIEYRDGAEKIFFEDVSLCPEDLASLVEICNLGHLSPIHLSDVVEDFLADITCNLSYHD